jgi:hypothetical protein
MEYLLPWLIAGCAGIGLTLAVYKLTWFISAGFWRALVVLLVPVLLLTPAPVPGYQGQFAPAFLVLLFEGLLQAEGEVKVALRVLGYAAIACAGGVILGFAILRFTRKGPSGP